MDAINTDTLPTRDTTVTLYDEDGDVYDFIFRDELDEFNEDFAYVIAGNGSTDVFLHDKYFFPQFFIHVSPFVEVRKDHQEREMLSLKALGDGLLSRVELCAPSGSVVTRKTLHDITFLARRLHHVSENSLLGTQLSCYVDEDSHTSYFLEVFVPEGRKRIGKCFISEFTLNNEYKVVDGDCILRRHVGLEDFYNDPDRPTPRDWPEEELEAGEHVSRGIVEYLNETVREAVIHFED